MLASVADGIDADVIVLDWGLPTMSGIDLLPRLRREGIQLPVVFLTGRSSPNHEHLAFDRGALDFVDKARGVPILAKRIRVIVESSKRPQALEVDEVLHCGRLMLKPRVSRAYWDEVDVNLTLTEFNIVRLLASNVGNHVTYRAVYDCMHHVGFIAGSGEMATEPMSVHRSSAFETSSDSSIPSSPKSRTTPHSVTAGESPRTPQP